MIDGSFIGASIQLAMQGFVTKIVDLMKENQLFAWQGGPVIMAQVIDYCHISAF